MKSMHLVKNMRVQALEASGMDAERARRFSYFLLEIWEGRIREENLERRN